MNRVLVFAALVLLAVQPARGEGLLDWLDSVRPPSAHQQPTRDHAELLTLEPGQQEMYPQVSPDGRYMLVAVHDHRRLLVSRRLTENGDPLNVVSDDVHAPDSIAWYGKGQVSFLSERAGGLGIWVKAADGQGVVKRLMRLFGHLTQARVLPDGSLLAVRLDPLPGHNAPKRTLHMRRDAFENWQVNGFKTRIVRINADGLEQVLAEGSNPAVSPDGKWIVFSMAAGRSRHLFLMRIDGSELVQLTDARSIDVQPAWSPDGRWIVFASNRGAPDMRHPQKSNWDIWAIGRDGRGLTRLTEDPARDGAPSVGPDGRVYFHSDRKISADERALHQVSGPVGGFHVWVVRAPKLAAR
ncbi:MAG: TolB protein [Zetaproteobacteria bacterium]|nr:MAG: TolB protein [Zetaproteobacteria bacterium]